MEEGFPAAFGREQSFRDAGRLRGFGDSARVTQQRGEGCGFSDTLDLAVVADAEEHRGLAFVIETVERTTLDRLTELGLTVTADPAGEDELTIT